MATSSSGTSSSGTSSSGPSSSGTSSTGRAPWWLAWAAMAVIVVVALFIGTTREDGPKTAQDRVTAIARTIKCPLCGGQTVADSNGSASKVIRVDIADRVAQGQSDDEIRAYYGDVYGPETLLTPSASGVVGIVWILPVVVGALALAGLVLAFTRWRRIPAMSATDADRDLVASAQRQAHEGPPSARDGDAGDGSAHGGPS